MIARTTEYLVQVALLKRQIIMLRSLKFKVKQLVLLAWLLLLLLVLLIKRYPTLVLWSGMIFGADMSSSVDIDNKNLDTS